MVPPPDSTGDEFPDFESMSFEEQMAWLESLAKRQGAKDEELTTAADLDIPIPTNGVDTGPGYIPYSESSSKKPVSKAPEPPPAQPVEVEPPPPEKVEVSEPVAESADPMQWLDSLAAHPGQEMTELGFVSDEDTSDLLESLGTLDELSIEQPWEESVESVVPAVETPVSDGSVDDLLGGVDPMLWLESLAARQGAKQEELTTTADFEVAEIPEDTVIDEPGYVPFDVISGSGKAARTESAPPPPPEVLPEVSTPAVEEKVPTPELFEDIVVDEPEDYSLFDSFEAAEAQAVGEAPAELGAVDESLSWLVDLASESDTDVSELLSLDDSMFQDLDLFGGEESTPEAESVSLFDQPESGDPLAGMTDEEIAYAQAQGNLTGEQELAWLKRQAAKLAEARQVEDEPAYEVEAGDVEPAVPAELPAWLEQMREDTDTSPALEVDESAELADWLTQVEPTESSAVHDELSLDADVDSLWAEAIEVESLPEEMDVESELDAFLQSGLVPDEMDQLAEALDDEFDRKALGDETEPEWYTEAVNLGAVEFEDDQLSAPEAAETVEAALAEATPVDMPDWLKETEEEAPAVSEGMPSWLSESFEASTAALDTGDMPDWLTEAVETPEAANLDWLPEEPEPSIEPEPVVEPKIEAAPVKTEPVAIVEPEAPALPSIPENELFAKYRERLERDPDDHANRLSLARALFANHDLPASLNHYEVLIDRSQLLQDVADDLASLVKEHVDEPRVRRLLGDTYMRRGMLQDALDAYRSALDQL